MTPDHERIEELLAGYSLRALEGANAAEADHILATHVPGCPQCRRTLADFDAVVGDLALAAPAVRPAELLWPSLKRQLPERERRSGRGIAVWVAAAAVVAVVILSGWNVLLNSQVTATERRQAGLNNMVSTLMQEDGSKMIRLEGDASEAAPAPETRQPQVMVSFQPGVPHGWVLGMDVPPPAPGHVYQLWLGRGGFYTASERFVPDEIGLVRVFVPADLSGFDQIAITQEAAQVIVIEPGGVFLWDASVTPTLP